MIENQISSLLSLNLQPNDLIATGNNGSIYKYKISNNEIAIKCVK